MADPAPPPEVLLAFLGTLNETVAAYEERLVPVVRGSLLLQHWFGELARPAADLDLECFVRAPTREEEEERDEDFEEEYGEIEEGRFGRYGDYESLVDFGKAMCRYAAGRSQRYQWRRDEPTPEVEFHETDAPKDGASLWVYGTPGERYYVGWEAHSEEEQSGRMQIDIAAGGYPLDAIDTATIKAPNFNGKNVKCAAYTPETLLAAKLSWLVRSFQRAKGNEITWKGEPKDLFDTHLILTQAKKFRPEAFQKSLLAIGELDKLEWNNLDSVLAAGHGTMQDKDFANWKAFAKKHKDVVSDGPVEMLKVIAEKLEPLLGDFYLRDEMPFLRTINSGVPDEVANLVYADWLDEHGHTDRGTLLRELTTFLFRRDELKPKQKAKNRAALLAGLPGVSQPWLCQLLGTSAHVAEVKKQVEEGK